VFELELVGTGMPWSPTTGIDGLAALERSAPPTWTATNSQPRRWEKRRTIEVVVVGDEPEALGAHAPSLGAHRAEQGGAHTPLSDPGLDADHLDLGPVGIVAPGEEVGRLPADLGDERRSCVEVEQLAEA
jgi:hypothetical protein